MSLRDTRKRSRTPVGVVDYKLSTNHWGFCSPVSSPGAVLFHFLLANL